MKFSKLSLAATAAAWKTSLSKAASPDGSTSFLPEASAASGHRKLQVQGLACPAEVGYVDCVNGYQDGNPGTTCYAACDNGALCCNGVDACNEFTGRVCKDGSCYGRQACFQSKIGLVLNSCKGPINIGGGNVGACYHFGGTENPSHGVNNNALSIGLSNSCIGPTACWRAVRFNGRLNGNIIDSCHGQWSCYGVAQDGTVDGDIINSCLHNDPYSTQEESACYAMAVGAAGYVASVTDSCYGTNSCGYAGQNGRIEGGLSNACQGEWSCWRVAAVAGSSVSKVHDCCNTPQVHNTPGGCYYTTWDEPIFTDSHLPDDCTAGTTDPTASPTTSPTVAGPLTLDYDKAEANFTSAASNELEVGFYVGVGRQVTVEVFETCDKGAEQVPSSLYTENVGEMLSHDPTESNLTHSKIVVGYNFNKAMMINSSLWNDTSEILTFCQVTSLTIPDPSGGGDDWVILSDRREIEIQFDLDANFEVDVNLADRTINNESETINFDDDVVAYKCRGGSDNSFNPLGGALPPNTQLAICIRVRDNNTSVNINRLADMTISQDGRDDRRIVDNGIALYSFTEMPAVSVGVIVKTLVPVGLFTFENDKSISISGTVDLELATGRKLRALVRENDAAEERREEAGYAVTVNLQSAADGLGPIGSSGGQAFAGKGLAALSLAIVAAFVFVM